MSEEKSTATGQSSEDGIREVDAATAAFLRIKRDRFLSGDRKGIKSMSAEEWAELAPKSR